MPVYDRSYRHWDGQLKRRAFRAWPIVTMGVKNALATKGGWLLTLTLRLFMAASCVPTLALFLINYFFYFRPDFLPPEMFKFFDQVAPYRVIQYPALTRINSLFLMIYAVLFGSGLIARDRASGALPLYLSRPLTLTDYILGKVGVIGWFMALFTLVPNLVLWAVGVMADPGEHALRDAMPHLLPIIAQNMAVILVYSLTILAVSSICRRPMFAGLIWFSLVILLPSFTSMAGSHRGVSALAAVSPNDALFSLGYHLFDIAGLFERATSEAEPMVRANLQGLFETVKVFASSTPLQATVSVLAWCGASLLVLVSVLRRQDVVVEAGK